MVKKMWMPSRVPWLAVLFVGLFALGLFAGVGSVRASEEGWKYWDECMERLSAYQPHSAFGDDSPELSSGGQGEADQEKILRELERVDSCINSFNGMTGIAARHARTIKRRELLDALERWKFWRRRHDVDLKQDPRYGTWAVVPHGSCAGAALEESGLSGRVWLHDYYDGSTDTAEVMVCIYNGGEYGLDIAFGRVRTEVDTRGQIVRINNLVDRRTMENSYGSIDPLTGEFTPLDSWIYGLYRLEPGAKVVVMRSLPIQGAVEQWCVIGDFEAYHEVDVLADCLRSGQESCSTRRSVVHLEGGRCGHGESE